MKQEQSFPQFDNPSERQLIESNQQIQRERRLPDEKKKLTPLIANIFYNFCPRDKRELFQIFWQNYQKTHPLDAANAKKRKTLQRRFNEILNTLQACGFVKRTKKIVDIVSQRNEEYNESGVQPKLSRKSQQIQQLESLQKQTIYRQKRIQIKKARISQLDQMIDSLKEHIKSRRLSRNQEKQIDIKSIVFLAEKNNLPNIATFRDKAEDHQIFLRGQFEQLGEMFQMLKFIYAKKQPIKLEQDL